MLTTGPGAVSRFSSTSTVADILFASEYRREMSARTSTVYKYVKEHYLISGEHQVENPAQDRCEASSRNVVRVKCFSDNGLPRLAEACAS